MNFVVGQKILVIDSCDGKKYPCKVVKVDDETHVIRVHFIDWNSTYDEELPMDSNCIHMDNEESDEEAEDSFQDASASDNSIGSTIGRLLRTVDGDSKKVVSTYDIRLSFEENVKNFLSFKVPQLEKCASALSVKIIGDDGKKLYNKGPLTRKIVMKIKAHLPRECGHCNQIYSADLGAPQLFSCCSCMAPSHNCEDISKLHEILPSVYPKGLVWMCEVCLNDAHVGQNPTTIAGPSKMSSTDQNEQVPKGETKKTTDNDVEMVENTNTAKRALCKYYIYKKCRYGSKGDQCPFEHPKKCFKYTQHGTGSGRGCRKGKNAIFSIPLSVRVL